MKLRNKKTGEISDAILVDSGFICTNVWQGEIGKYETLAELNDEWEDCKPAEPLIKDKKIRKVVRAWAEANYIEKDEHRDCRVEFDRGEHRLKWNETGIEFNEITGLENLDDGEYYTIAELCGEEEE